MSWADANRWRGKVENFLEQLVDVLARLLAEQRIRMAVERRIDGFPVSGRQALLRQRQDIAFFASHVLPLELGVVFDGCREGIEFDLTAVLVARQRMREIANFLGTDLVLGLQ